MDVGVAQQREGRVGRQKLGGGHGARSREGRVLGKCTAARKEQHVNGTGSRKISAITASLFIK